MSQKRWILPTLDKEAAANLAEACDIHPFLAVLLTTRGITDPAAVREFLYGRVLTDDPFAFADMDLAVDRIQRAVDSGEKILIFGDYDADGITASVLLYLYLKQMQAAVSYYIPKREEGYGLSREALSKAAQDGVSLVITVDNGIAAFDETAFAAELGLDVVITDHHQPQESLPSAVAVVDPHRADCNSRFKDYAGVGVAFKLICALEGDEETLLQQYGDLVALGTLADVMPLIEENRVLVRAGLAVLNASPRPGIRALLTIAGIGDKPLTATSAVFTLSPRINAAGRMGYPEKAAQLLLAETEEEAQALAQEIHRLNTRRQTVEASILEEAIEQVRQHPDWLNQRVLVIAGKDWYHGVIGIIAARILERYGKPCLVLSVTEQGARGSGRSIPGFSLFDAVSACENCLTVFGGHELAVGIQLAPERIDEFREAINAYAAVTAPHMPVPELRIDCKLRPSQIDLEKLNLLEALEPFGTGNAAPLFGLFDMTLDNITAVGNGRHLRLTLSRDGTRLSAMRFHCTEAAFPFSCGEKVNAVVTLDRNEFRGVVSPSLIVRDMRYADTDQEALLSGAACFESLARRELPAGERPALPDREQLGRLYRLLRKGGTAETSLEQLHHTLHDGTRDFLRTRTELEILREAGLITVEDTGLSLRITVCDVTEKTDLSQTPLWQYLSEKT